MTPTTPTLGSASVTINTRTLRIGHQTYQLQNLARVQILTLPKPTNVGKGNSKLGWLAGIATFVFVTGFLASSVHSGGLGFVGLLLAVGVGIFVYQKTKVPYVPLYALVLETTGNPETALVSPDHDELNRISEIIIGAIENPPATEKIVQVNNVSLGDQYNQYGTHNIGRMAGWS